MKYLKKEFYYSDLYDWHTVKDCRCWIQMVTERGLPNEAEKLSKKEQKQFASAIIDVPLYFRTGERYLKKPDLINKWMDKDQAKDDFIKNHQAPISYCPKCNRQMKLVIDDLCSDIDDSNLRMLFIYRCDPCKEKKGLYNDGEPYVFKDDFCPKCHCTWQPKHIKSKDKITTKSNCDACGYKEENVLDLTDKPFRDKTDPEFAKDKARYCLSEKEGEEYQRFKTIEYPRIKKLVDKGKDEEKHKEIYKKARNIKKLTISELSDLLAKELEKVDYKSLVITNTEVSRDLIITFTIQDIKHGRDEGTSRSDLKKSLTKLLNNTNWKLMSDGISYKLGLLSGRLRGIDQEEVLVNEIKEAKGIHINGSVKPFL